MAKRTIDIDSLPSNNRESPNQVVKNRVRTKPRNRGGLAGDIRGMGNSLFETIILPAIKSTIADFFSNGVSMMLFGEDAGPGRRGSPRSYNRMYERRQPSYRGPQSRGRRREHPSRRPNRNIERTEQVFEDIFFDYRDDAQIVLAGMLERIAEYGQTTIGDLYSLVGIGSNYTNESWGWDNLGRVEIMHTSEGYLIDFPEPVYLN